MRVGLTFDLKDDFVPAPEDPPDAGTELDTEETIGALERAIRAHGHETLRIGGARALMTSGGIAPAVDLVFNISEGLGGRSREAQVPAILELLGIPYTGSDPLTMSLSLDKAMAKKVLRGEGVPTPDWVEVRRTEDLDATLPGFPLFVKPVHEGTAMGVTARSLVRDAAALNHEVRRLLRAYRQPVLVETFLPGREFTTGILGNRPPSPLGTMEVVVADPEEDGIYTGTSKARFEEKVRYLPASTIDPDLRRRIEEVALAAHRALDCRDFSRVDIRCDAQGRPHCIEVNPLAGLSPRTSDLAFIARFEGIAWETLIGRILDAAVARSGIPVAARG